MFGGRLNLIDEGQFGSWAYQMLNGKKLFEDIYPTYGPLYIYPLYYLFAIFGSDPFWVRVYLLSATFIGGILCLFCASIVRLPVPFRLVLIFAMGMLPIISLRQSLGIFAVTLFVTSLFKTRLSYAFISGVILVLSFFISPEIGIFSLLIIVLFSLFRFVFVKNIRFELKRFSVFVSAVIFSGLVMIMFLLSENVLSAYRDVTVDVFSSFSGEDVPNGKNFPYFTDILFANSSLYDFVKSVTSFEGLMYMTLFVYIGAGMTIIYRLTSGRFDSRDMWLVTFGLFGIFLYTILLTRSGIGHFYFVLTPVIFVTGLLYERLVSVHKNNNKEKYLSLFFIICITLFVARIFLIYRFEIIGSLSDVSTFPSRNTSETLHFMRLDSRQLTGIETIRTLVQTHSHNSDDVFFLSNSPMMYLIVQRNNPTRYDLPYIAGSPEKRYEIQNDLKTLKPSLILYDSTMWNVDGLSNKIRLPEVYDFIRKEYILIGKTHGVEIYKVKK